MIAGLLITKRPPPPGLCGAQIAMHACQHRGHMLSICCAYGPARSRELINESLGLSFFRNSTGSSSSLGVWIGPSDVVELDRQAEGKHGLQTVAVLYRSVCALHHV